MSPSDETELDMPELSVDVWMSWHEFTADEACSRRFLCTPSALCLVGRFHKSGLGLVPDNEW